MTLNNLKLKLIFIFGASIIFSWFCKNLPDANIKGYNIYCNEYYNILTGSIFCSNLPFISSKLFFLILLYIAILIIVSLSKRIDEILFNLLILGTVLIIALRDPIVINGIIFCGLNFYISKKINSWLISTLTKLFVLVLTIIISGPVTIIWILISLVISHFNDQSRQQLKINNLDLLKASLLLVLIGFTVYSPYLPELPKGSSIVFDDQEPGLARPIFGPNITNYQIVDVKRLIATFSTTGFILAGMVLFYALFNRHQIVKNKLKLFEILFLILICFEVSVPTRFSQLLPLNTISRIIPGLFYQPFQIYGLTSVLMFIIFSPKNDLIKFISLGLIVILFAIQPISNLKIIEDLTSPTTNYSVLSTSAKELLPVHYSPEKYISGFNKLSYVPTCNPEKNCSQITDNQFITRWHSKLQNGSEKITINLNTPSRVNLIILDSGAYSSDFPRQINIKDCSTGSIILNHYDWPGSFRSLKSNTLYFLAQTNRSVELMLASPPLTECLEISQTGVENYFDWSIVELSIYGSTK